MSKLGRYSADRKKVATLSSTTTGSHAQCGTLFLLNSGSATTINSPGRIAGGGYLYFLPPLSASAAATGGNATVAGQGWWAKFVVKAGGSVSGPGNTDLIHIATCPSDTVGLVNCSVVSGSSAVGGQNEGFISSSDGVTFDVSACSAGDQVELWTDGSNWYGQAHCSGGAGIVAYTDSIYPAK
jgi:hypothetical protein